MMPVRGTALTTVFLLILTAGWSSAQTPGHSPQPLNVVLIILDDVRWDALGAAGNGIVRTPRIDELAYPAMLLSSAHWRSAAVLPRTQPESISRASVAR
jgi:hypothetical protein